MRAGLAGSLAMLSALLPAPSEALECNEYSIAATYWFYEAQPESYVLALGEFSGARRIKAQKAVSTDSGFRPGVELWKAKFTGYTASRRAFDKPLETEVTLEFPDYSFIGGGYDTSGEVERLPVEPGLIWLKRTATGYKATADLCLPPIDTDPASVKPALRCLRGGYCPKS